MKRQSFTSADPSKKSKDIVTEELRILYDSFSEEVEYQRRKDVRGSHQRARERFARDIIDLDRRLSAMSLEDLLALNIGGQNIYKLIVKLNLTDTVRTISRQQPVRLKPDLSDIMHSYVSKDVFLNILHIDSEGLQRQVSRGDYQYIEKARSFDEPGVAAELFKLLILAAKRDPAVEDKIYREFQAQGNNTFLITILGKEKDREILKLLIDLLQNFEPRRFAYILTGLDRSGFSPLQQIFKSKHFSLVEPFINLLKGIKSNNEYPQIVKDVFTKPNNSGFSCLQQALINKDTKSIKLLLEFLKEVFPKDRSGKYPQELRDILQHKNRQGISIINDALKLPEIAPLFIDLLKEVFLNPDGRYSDDLRNVLGNNPKGPDPLQQILMLKNPEMTLSFLDLLTKVFPKDARGKYPQELARMLQKPDMLGFTPLHQVIFIKNPKVTTLFIDLLKDTFPKDSKGDYPQALKEILKHVSNDGLSQLQSVIMNADFDSFQSFIKLLKEVFPKNERGEYPQELREIFKHRDDRGNTLISDVFKSKDGRAWLFMNLLKDLFPAENHQTSEEFSKILLEPNQVGITPLQQILISEQSPAFVLSFIEILKQTFPKDASGQYPQELKKSFTQENFKGFDQLQQLLIFCKPYNPENLKIIDSFLTLLKDLFPKGADGLYPREIKDILLHQNKDGVSSIHEIFELENPEATQLLLNFLKEVFPRNERGEYPQELKQSLTDLSNDKNNFLHSIFFSNNPQVIKLGFDFLKEVFPEPHSVEMSTMLKQLNSKSISPLRAALTSVNINQSNGPVAIEFIEFLEKFFKNPQGEYSPDLKTILTTKDQRGASPLYDAIRSNNPEVILAFTKMCKDVLGNDLYVKELESVITYRDDLGFNIMHRIASKENPELLLKLIDFTRNAFGDEKAFGILSKISQAKDSKGFLPYYFKRGTENPKTEVITSVLSQFKAGDDYKSVFEKTSSTLKEFLKSEREAAAPKPPEVLSDKLTSDKEVQTDVQATKRLQTLLPLEEEEMEAGQVFLTESYNPFFEEPSHSLFPEDQFLTAGHSTLPQDPREQVFYSDAFLAFLENSILPVILYPTPNPHIMLMPVIPVEIVTYESLLNQNAEQELSGHRQPHQNVIIEDQMARFINRDGTIDDTRYAITDGNTVIHGNRSIQLIINPQNPSQALAHNFHFDGLSTRLQGSGQIQLNL